MELGEQQTATKGNNSLIFEIFQKLDVNTFIYCGRDHINDYSLQVGKFRLGITPGGNMKPYNQVGVRGLSNIYSRR